MNLCAVLLASAMLLWSTAPGFAQAEDLTAKARRAREAMSAGKYQEAIMIYGELARALPDLPGLRMNLGMAHYMAGQYRDAARQLETAVEKDPGLTEAWLFLGASHQALGDPGRAVPPLQKYVQKEGDDPRGRRLLGDALFSLKRFRQAAEQFETLSRLNPEDPNPWFGLGRSYEALAGEAFASLEKAAPESGYWFALLAASRLAQQQYRSAFFFYRKALEEQPDLRGIHIALSRIYRRTGNEEWAAAEEEKEMRLGLPDCESEKVVCEFLAGRFRDALAVVEGKNTPEAWYWQSQAYNQLALEALSRLSRLPPSVELHELIAEIHRNQGRHLEAAGELKKALELSPGNPALRRELAASLVLGTDYEGAGPLVDSLLKEDAGSAHLNFLAGEVRLNLQKPNEAIPFLEKAVEKDSGFSAAHASLGRALMSLGEAARAIPHLRAALETDQDGSLHYQLARAYRTTGERDLEREMLAKYQEIQKSLQAEKRQLEEEVRITPP